MKNRVLIQNLPSSATPEALRAFFSDLGHSVQAVELGPNDKWRLPPGYAVVTLPPDADFRKAIKDADGKDFQGRSLLVSGVRPLQWRYRSERAA